MSWCVRPRKKSSTHIRIVSGCLNLFWGGTSESRMSPIAIVSSYVWVKGGERRLVYEQEAAPVLNGPVMPRRCKLQHLASLGFRYFGWRRGFGWLWFQRRSLDTGGQSTRIPGDRWPTAFLPCSSSNCLFYDKPDHDAFCHSASPTGPAETHLFKWLFAHIVKSQPETNGKIKQAWHFSNLPLGHFASNHAASSAASEQTLLSSHLATWIPGALYPVKIPSMHPLIGQSLGGQEVTSLSDPREALVASPDEIPLTLTECEWNKNCARVWHQLWDTLYYTEDIYLPIQCSPATRVRVHQWFRVADQYSLGQFPFDMIAIPCQDRSLSYLILSSTSA